MIKLQDVQVARWSSCKMFKLQNQVARMMIKLQDDQVDNLGPGFFVNTTTSVSDFSAIIWVSCK